MLLMANASHDKIINPILPPDCFGVRQSLLDMQRHLLVRGAKKSS